MRGNYVIFQRTGQMTSGQITLQFTDKEDQAITYFVDDWRQKIADRDTKYSFRKDDLVADAQLVITNSSRIKVRTLNFYNCIIRDAGIDENGTAEDGTDRAEVPLTLDFEHYERRCLRISHELLGRIIISISRMANKVIFNDYVCELGN